MAIKLNKENAIDYTGKILLWRYEQEIPDYDSIKAFLGKEAEKICKEEYVIMEKVLRKGIRFIRYNHYKIGWARKYYIFEIGFDRIGELYRLNKNEWKQFIKTEEDDLEELRVQVERRESILQAEKR